MSEKPNQVFVFETEKNNTYNVAANDRWVEVVDRYVEESEFNSRAVAIRSLVIAGIRASVLADPRRSQCNKTETNSSQNNNSTTIRELVPRGKDNAVKIPDEFQDIIEQEIIGIVQNDSEIKRDGMEIYR